MSDTHEYVEKLHENQQKQEKNRKAGKGDVSGKLPNKQHSTKK